MMVISDNRAGVGVREPRVGKIAEADEPKESVTVPSGPNMARNTGAMTAGDRITGTKTRTLAMARPRRLEDTMTAVSSPKSECHRNGEGIDPRCCGRRSR